MNKLGLFVGITHGYELVHGLDDVALRYVYVVPVYAPARPQILRRHACL